MFCTTASSVNGCCVLILGKPLRPQHRTCSSNKLERLMADLRYLESVIPADMCSRSQFQAQYDKLEAMLRAVGQADALEGSASKSVNRSGNGREPEIEKILQRVIVRAKGMVSEEMLIRHQREIPVDEIPDYAVTHLLADLGEQEVQGLAR